MDNENLASLMRVLMTQGLNTVSFYFEVGMNEKLISEAIELRKNGKQNEALKILEKVLSESPDNPNVNYQIAWTYDSLGKESEAVPFYEKAISLGLVDDREGAMLGLGSTFRCLGEYKKSLDIFEQAILEFPNSNSLKTFRALTLYNLEQPGKAVSELLLLLLDTTGDSEIKNYDRALRFYSDKLDEVWK